MGFLHDNFRFDGRLNRRDFRRYYIAYAVLWLVVVAAFPIIGIIFFGVIAGAGNKADKLLGTAGLDFLLYIAALILPIALFVAAGGPAARRAHDRDQSGWWIALVLLVVPFSIIFTVRLIVGSNFDFFLLAPLGLLMQRSITGPIFFFLIAAVLFSPFTIYVFLPGKAGPTRYDDASARLWLPAKIISVGLGIFFAGGLLLTVWVLVAAPKHPPASALSQNAETDAMAAPQPHSIPVPAPQPAAPAPSAATLPAATDQAAAPAVTIPAPPPMQDCKIRSPVAALICGDVQLTAMQREIQSLVRQGVETAADARSFRAEQDDWETQERDRCRTRSCLLTVYSARRARLRLWVHG